MMIVKSFLVIIDISDRRRTRRTEKEKEENIGNRKILGQRRKRKMKL